MTAESRTSSPYPPLAGLAEVADICDVRKQRAHQLTMKVDFPKPITVLSATPVWDAREVERWAAQWRSGLKTAPARTSS